MLSTLQVTRSVLAALILSWGVIGAAHGQVLLEGKWPGRELPSKQYVTFQAKAKQSLGLAELSLTAALRAPESSAPHLRLYYKGFSDAGELLCHGVCYKLKVAVAKDGSGRAECKFGLSNPYVRRVDCWLSNAAGPTVYVKKLKVEKVSERSWSEFSGFARVPDSVQISGLGGEIFSEGFEENIEGWRCFIPTGGKLDHIRSSQDSKEGEGALRFEVKKDPINGGMHGILYSKPVPLPKGGEYILEFWARGKGKFSFDYNNVFHIPKEWGNTSAK